MAGIELKNVTKQFKDIIAVNNVSFQVKEGELLGLMGPNGAGKTTLVSMISNLLDPTSGEIYVNGMDVKKNAREVKQILGIVPQEIALYETLNVVDNLQFFGKMYGMKGAHLKKRIKEILEIIGLEKRAKNPIRTFSGGMKRRVNIGAGLIHSPRIIILDEPTVGIDPQSRNYILDTIKQLNKEGMTVIYTSHYMEEIESLCDNIGIMDEGKLIRHGDKNEIKRAEGIDRLKIRCAQPNDKQKQRILAVKGVKGVTAVDEGIAVDMADVSRQTIDVLGILKEEGVAVTSIDTESANLEMVFLHLTGKTLRDE